MKKIVIAVVVVFCFNNLVFSQDVSVDSLPNNEKQENKVNSSQKMKYFGEDNTFYLGNMRLSENEVRQTLSKNMSALEAWEKGNTLKGVNTGMKVATGVLITVGGVVTIISFFVAAAEATATLIFLPVLIASNTDPISHTSDRWLAAGLCLMGGGIITGIMISVTKTNYQDCYSNAAGIYNKGLYKTSVSLHIGTTGNGLGVSLNF